jgi:hypothetical protein
VEKADNAPFDASDNEMNPEIELWMNTFDMDLSCTECVELPTEFISIELDDDSITEMPLKDTSIEPVDNGAFDAFDDPEIELWTNTFDMDLSCMECL